MIVEKERELEQLSRDLDDKLRFSQKTFERPGSGAGRSPSQSGSFDESRSVDFSERPQSRDDRRGIPGGKDRGFLGNRDLGRPVIASQLLLVDEGRNLRRPSVLEYSGQAEMSPEDAAGRLPVDLKRHTHAYSG